MADPREQPDQSARLRLVQEPTLNGREWMAVATLDDGSEIRMRNLGDRVEIRTWDPTRSCRPPMIDVDHLAGRHVIDVRPARPAEVAGRGEPVETALARDLCGHCGQGLPHTGTSWREAGACREADAAVDSSGGDRG